MQKLVKLMDDSNPVTEVEPEVLAEEQGDAI